MKLHRYVDHQRLHIMTKDVISLSISVLLLFRHYISHKITFGAPSSGGVLRSACGAFITPACLYRTLRDIVLMVDKNKGAILEFIAIVCWVYCYVLKTVYRLCTCTSECANADQHW